MFETTIEIKVPFHDVDSIHIAWHGHYAKYFEVARCELLDQFNYGYQAMLDSGYGWPVVDMRIRYVQPARFEQRINVRAKLTEWEHRIKVDYLITDAETGRRLTKGYTIQAAVKLDTGELCLESPPVLFEKLGIADE